MSQVLLRVTNIGVIPNSPYWITLDRIGRGIFISGDILFCRSGGQPGPLQNKDFLEEYTMYIVHRRQTHGITVNEIYND